MFLSWILSAAAWAQVSLRLRFSLFFLPHIALCPPPLSFQMEQPRQTTRHCSCCGCEGRTITGCSCRGGKSHLCRMQLTRMRSVRGAPQKLLDDLLKWSTAPKTTTEILDPDPERTSSNASSDPEIPKLEPVTGTSTAPGTTSASAPARDAPEWDVVS